MGGVGAAVPRALMCGAPAVGSRAAASHGAAAAAATAAAAAEERLCSDTQCRVCGAGCARGS